LQGAKSIGDEIGRVVDERPKIAKRQRSARFFAGKVGIQAASTCGTIDKIIL
jgi:hypothetical protein